MNIEIEYSQPREPYDQQDPYFLLNLHKYGSIDYIRSVSVNGSISYFTFNVKSYDLHIYGVSYKKIRKIEIDYSSIADERNEKIQSLGI